MHPGYRSARCLCVCPCIYVCLRACTCTCLHVHAMCAGPCAFMCLCACTYMWAYLCESMSMYMFMCVWHACVHVHTGSKLSPGPVNNSHILCQPHEGHKVWKVPEDVESAIACTHMRFRQGFGKLIPGFSLSLSLK